MSREAEESISPYHTSTCIHRARDNRRVHPEQPRSALGITTERTRDKEAPEEAHEEASNCQHTRKTGLPFPL